jgi:flagellum-specific ATP synthase
MINRSGNRRTGIAAALAASQPKLARIDPFRLEGRLVGVSGLAADLAGLSALLAIGDRVTLAGRAGAAPIRTEAEVIGFQGGRARAMAFTGLDGLGPGSPVLARTRHASAGRAGMLAVDDSWLGRVIDPLGQPLDELGPLLPGPLARPVRGRPLPATARARLGPRLETGVRVIDGFATCRQGQRMGLFAGSGVGKSILLAMLARGTACDVVVLALVGERGREVREFLEDDLGADGLARSVVVVATSDSLPLMRREAAYAAMTVAEHFRDRGLSVLLLMDSVTRFCLALREIGLSAGEPPATRGYPPSVFAELPRLLERAGPGAQPPPDAAGVTSPAGMITALFTVLVEGDDHNEPVADAVRGILDGHVTLDRRIAEGGRYPAVDVLRSLSRAVPGCLSAEEYALTRRARAILALHGDMADLVRLGAYRAGTDPAVDEAILVAPRLEALLRQERHERTALPDSFALLDAALTPPAAATAGGAAHGR